MQNTNLVQLKEGKAITTSLLIAEYFGKEHKNVLQSIENLQSSKEFNELNFKLISYRDSMNRVKPCYEITRDGFTILAMGYTGEKAMKFKEEYIKQFNKMEAHIKQQITTMTTPTQDEIEYRNRKAILNSANLMADFFELDKKERLLYAQNELESKGYNFPHTKQLEIVNEISEVFFDKTYIYNVLKLTPKQKKDIRPLLKSLEGNKAYTQLMPYMRKGHSGTYYKYNQNSIDLIKKELDKLK